MNRSSPGISREAVLNRIKFRIVDRLNNFRHDFAGLWTLLRTQQNARIHFAATILVSVLDLWLLLLVAEWCWLVLAICAVWTAEALNAAVEFLAVAVYPDRHSLIKIETDVAAPCFQ